jgi:hypothetical protein
MSQNWKENLATIVFGAKPIIKNAWNITTYILGTWKFIHKNQGDYWVGLTLNEHSSKCGTEWKTGTKIDNYTVPQHSWCILALKRGTKVKKIQNIVEQKHGTKIENYDVVQQHRGVKCGTKMCSKCWTLMYSKCGTKMCLKMLDPNVLKMWDQNVFKMWDQKWKTTSSHFVVSFVNFFVFKLWDQNASNSIIPWAEPKTTPTRGVLDYGLAIYIKKHLNAKEELWKLKHISPCKNIIFQKSSTRNQNPSRYYYNSIITNLKFQQKPKHHLSKIL